MNGPFCYEATYPIPLRAKHGRGECATARAIDRFQSAGKTGMMMVHLAIHLQTGPGSGGSHALGIDNHHIIAHLHTGCEGRLMFAQQNACNLCRKAAQVLSVGIRHEPFALDLAFFRIIRFVHFQSPYSLLGRLNTSLQPESIRVREPGPREFHF